MIFRIRLPTSCIPSKPPPHSYVLCLHTQAISSAVADAGYNISTINAATDPVDDTLSQLTLVVRNDFTPLSQEVRNNIIIGTKKEEKTDELSLSCAKTVLFNTICRLPNVVQVVPVAPLGNTGETPEKTAATSKHGEDIIIAPPINTGLLYLIHDFASAPSWTFKAHYDVLPRDPYVQNISVGRFREYSKYRVVFPEHHSRTTKTLHLPKEVGSSDFYIPLNGLGGTGMLLEISDPEFNQPPGYNFTGRRNDSTAPEKPMIFRRAVDRRFRRVSPAMASLPEFAEIICRFANHVRLDPRYAQSTQLNLGVHAIRIVADETAEEVLRGQIVPEGMHQDGYRYVCIGCTGWSNITDWKLYVYGAGPRGTRPRKDATPLFSHSLAPGSAVFLDDTRVWHDADDIKQADLHKPGHVDFIVITLAAEENNL